LMNADVGPSGEPTCPACGQEVYWRGGLVRRRHAAHFRDTCGFDYVNGYRRKSEEVMAAEPIQATVRKLRPRRKIALRLGERQAGCTVCDESDIEVIGPEVEHDPAGAISRAGIVLRCRSCQHLTRWGFVQHLAARDLGLSPYVGLELERLTN
jgi:hypothetical protein